MLSRYLLAKKIMLLSVIVPAYNVGNYIVECIDSLLQQIPSPNELIVINDGSTDNTLALVENKYAHLDNVNIVTIPNGGLGNARDTGISMAQGDFIFCCDPDDIVCDGLFVELSEAAARYPDMEMFCFNSLMFEDTHPDKTYPKVRHIDTGVFHPQKVFASLLRSGSYTSATWNYVLKKHVIEQYQMKYINRLHEDHVFTLEAFMRARSAYVSSRLYYKQRIRNGSLTNSVKSENFFRERYNAFITSYEKLRALTENTPSHCELRRLYLIHSFRLMINLCIADNRNVPIYMISAIKYFGKNLKPDSPARWLLLREPELYSNLLMIRLRLRNLTNNDKVKVEV